MQRIQSGRSLPVFCSIMNQVIVFIIYDRPWPLITVGRLVSIYPTGVMARGYERSHDLLRSLEKHNGNRRRLLGVRKL